MKKIIILLAAIIAVGTFTFMRAQTIHHSQWGGQPRLKSTSAFIPSCLAIVEEAILETYAGTKKMKKDDDYAEFYKKYSWIIPEFSVESNDPYKFKTPNDDVKLHEPYWWRDVLLWGDYSHDFDISAGYELNWKSLTTPFGAYIAADYEFKQLHMRINDGEAHKIKSQAIIPSAGIRLHFGSCEHLVRPLISFGAGYVYNLKYKGPEGRNVDILNNGVRGMASIGIEYTRIHASFVIEYQYDFYKYYNEDYTPDNGVTFPHEGWTNNFGTLALRLSHAF